MGSSGIGRFGNYPMGGSSRSSGRRDGMIGGSGTGGGFGGKLVCPNVIKHIRLEDVAMSEYYMNKHSVPEVDGEVELSGEIHFGRLVVSLISTGEVIGNLPTDYNYLIDCINMGKEYTGSILSSGTSPVPYVVVTLYA